MACSFPVDAEVFTTSGYTVVSSIRITYDHTSVFNVELINKRLYVTRRATIPNSSINVPKSIGESPVFIKPILNAEHRKE